MVFAIVPEIIAGCTTIFYLGCIRKPPWPCPDRQKFRCVAAVLGDFMGHMVEISTRFSNSKGYHPWNPGIMVIIFTCFWLMHDCRNFLEAKLKGPFAMLPIWELLLSKNSFKGPIMHCIHVPAIFFLDHNINAQTSIQSCKASLRERKIGMMG